MPGPLMGSGGGWLKVWLRRTERAVSSQKRNYACVMLAMPLPVSLLSCFNVFYFWLVFEFRRMEQSFQHAKPKLAATEL